MKRMMSYVSSGIDKREGSLVYTCLSAAAMQLAMFSIELDDLYNGAFADTAEGENLDKLCALLGLERNGETKAVVKVVSDDSLSVGQKFSCGDYVYEICEICDGYYAAECSVSGSEPNTNFGELLPEEDYALMGSASITEIIAEGCDEEDDDSLRKRFFLRARYPVCAGNKNYYREEIGKLSGVGAVKIFPASEPNGVIRVVIADTDNSTPSDELISYVQNAVDPTDKSGQGSAIAPIGHRVTVEGVKSVDVTVKVRLTLSDASISSVKNTANYYISEAAETENALWGSKDNIILRDSFFENIYLENFDRVTDVEIVSVNGEENRLILGEDEIIGKVTVGYVQ
jgi:uncharacterized phage protein gp47/JayE